jgi:hypothetical protein
MEMMMRQRQRRLTAACCLLLLLPEPRLHKPYMCHHTISTQLGFQDVKIEVVSGSHSRLSPCQPQEQQSTSRKCWLKCKEYVCASRRTARPRSLMLLLSKPESRNSNPKTHH